MGHHGPQSRFGISSMYIYIYPEWCHHQFGSLAFSARCIQLTLLAHLRLEEPRPYSARPCSGDMTIYDPLKSSPWQHLFRTYHLNWVLAAGAAGAHASSSSIWTSPRDDDPLLPISRWVPPGSLFGGTWLRGTAAWLT